MRWYGQVWEFANLFWWQHVGWNSRNGLDCTHSSSSAAVSTPGLYCMHRYFLQAMIDGYYEEQ